MHYLVNCNYMQYYKNPLSNRRCCNLSFSHSHVMVYVLNSDNCCYLLSFFVLLDDVSMTSFAFVYFSLLIMVFSKEDKILIKCCGNRKVTVRKGLLRNFWTRTGTEGDWIICWRNCMRRALWNGRLVAAGDVHRARHRTLMLLKTCVEKHRTSFFQTCGHQKVQISIQLTTRSGLSCSIVYTRQKSTPSTNWSSGWLKSGVALNSRLSTVDMAVDQWRRRLGTCVCAKGGHFEHNLWT